MTPDDARPPRRSAHRRQGSSVAPSSNESRWSGVDHASRATADLLAGLALWGLIGWLLDRWLGTEPWLLSIGIMVGFAASLYLVWLRSTRGRGGNNEEPN